MARRSHLIALTGYAGGLAAKRWLLEHEHHQLRVDFDAPPSWVRP